MPYVSRALSIQRLRDTTEKLKSLSHKKFDYSDYVTHSKGDCGTVCCVAGWYPDWFPQAGLRWTLGTHGGLSLKFPSRRRETETPKPSMALERWHGLSKDTISFLFFGDPCEIAFRDNAERIEIMREHSNLEWTFENERLMGVQTMYGVESLKKEVLAAFNLVVDLLERKIMKN